MCVLGGSSTGRLLFSLSKNMRQGNQLIVLVGDVNSHHQESTGIHQFRLEELVNLLRLSLIQKMETTIIYCNRTDGSMSLR